MLNNQSEKHVQVGGYCKNRTKKSQKIYSFASRAGMNGKVGFYAYLPL